MNSSLLIGRIAASVFIVAGAFKVLLWAWHWWQPSAPSFGAMLTQLGVPFASAVALAVPLLEVVAGFCILRGYLVRACAALLAIDMVVAIALVGWPGWRGRVVNIGQQSIGQEPWRLPLELLLLAAMLWLVWKPNKPAKVL